MNHRGKLFCPSVLRCICTLLAVILVFMLGASHRMLRQAAAQETETSAVTAPAPTALTTEPAALATEPAASETTCVTLSDTQTPEPTQILLIGQDRLEGEKRARSDSMILCSFFPSEKKLILTSFLRDLYVQIPGYQKDRLNAAYAWGGAALLCDTLSENFGLTVDGCVEVDFSQFPKIIDLMGGITLELRQDEANAINAVADGELSEGLQELNGQQALAFVRIRKLDSDGDFSRTQRQRKVLSSMLRRYKDVNPITAFSILTKVIPMLSSDLAAEQMISLTSELLPMLSELEIISQQIPAEGTFSYSRVRDMEVLTADLDAARKLLKESGILP